MENGKENIINRIAEDTAAKVREIEQNGKTVAQEIIDSANAAVQAEKEKAEQKIKADSAEFLRRAAVRAEMDAKKYLLSEKQKLVTDVYAQAKKQILALPKAKYLALMEKLLKQYSEKGEEIIICKKDADVITDKIATKYGCRLANHFGNFDGGFVLCGFGYEKNVTLDVIIWQARTATESKVLQILFDGE